MLKIALYVSLTLQQVYVPQTGDLLFQDLDCGPLCDAIEEVTQGYRGARISHMGMVLRTDSGVFVLEAVSEGVVLTPLDTFICRSTDKGGNPKVLAGRLKKAYQSYIPDAVSFGVDQLGTSYDKVYLMHNDSYYCSELLYQCFYRASEDSSFFNVSPMTFKVPGSDRYDPAWQIYYNELHQPIPEGLPGLNPGGISRSEKIDILHVYGIPDGYIVE